MKIESIADVQARIDATEGRRAGLIQQQAENGAKLAELQAGAAARFLADGDDSSIRSVVDLEARLDLIERALVLLDRNLAEAAVDLRRATAGDLRARAAKKRSELKELERKTGKLLGELSNLHGLNFTPCILNAQREGGWFEQFAGYKTAADHLRPSEVFGEPTEANRGTYGVPLSRRLHDEIVDLELQAESIENELAPPDEAIPVPDGFVGIPGVL